MASDNSTGGFEGEVVRINRTTTLDTRTGEPSPKVVVTVVFQGETIVELDDCGDRVAKRVGTYMEEPPNSMEPGGPSGRTIERWFPHEVVAAPDNDVDCGDEDGYVAQCPDCGHEERFCASFEQVYEVPYDLGTHPCASNRPFESSQIIDRRMWAIRQH